MDVVKLQESTPANGAIHNTAPTTNIGTPTPVSAPPPATTAVKVGKTNKPEATKKPAKVKAAPKAAPKKAAKAKTPVPRLAEAKRVKVQTQLYPAQKKVLDSAAKAAGLDSAQYIRGFFLKPDPSVVKQLKSIDESIQAKLDARAAKIAGKK